MALKKISKRSQFYLLSLYLGEHLELEKFHEEIAELSKAGYVNADLTISKKGEAYCHIQNYVGVNFEELVRSNSKRANTSLACILLEHITKSGVNDIKHLFRNLDSDVKYKLSTFLKPVEVG